MIDWKNFNWKEALPFTSIMLVGLYVSAYFVKIGEMIFYGYPFSLFKFNGSDLLLYSLKPLFLIAFISFTGFFVKTAYYSKIFKNIYIILSGVAFLLALLEKFLPALSQLNLRPVGSQGEIKLLSA